LAGVETRLKEIEDELVEGGKSTVLAAAARKLEQRRDVLVAEVEKLREELHADMPLGHAQSVWKALQEAGPDERHALRLRLRSLIGELVDKVYLKPEKHYGRVYCMAQVRFSKNDHMTEVWFGPMGTLGYVGGPEVYDLRNQGWARRTSLFAEAAALHVEPDTSVPSELPSKLSAAADVWLKVVRSTMRKESFRVVPSKVKRFVDFVGDMDVAKVNANVWNRWVRSVRSMLKKETLERSTARVLIGRSREFLRWLVANKLTVEFDGLNTSAEKLLG
jgi:hypothetical protein